MSRLFNRRSLTALVVIAGAALLQGCVYDPSTGGYYPCCAYPAYGYGYPAYGYYGGGVVVGGGGGYYRGGGWNGGRSEGGHWEGGRSEGGHWEGGR